MFDPYNILFGILSYLYDGRVYLPMTTVEQLINTYLTGHNGEPFTRTPSAKRTLDGFDLSLAFFAELSKADFLADYNRI